MVQPAARGGGSSSVVRNPRGRVAQGERHKLVRPTSGSLRGRCGLAGRRHRRGTGILIHDERGWDMPSFADQGYEIHVRTNDVVLVDRRLWGPGYAIVGLLLLAGVICLLGILVEVGVAEVGSNVPAVALFVGTAALLVPIAFLRRTFKERERLPIDEVRDVLIIDRPSNALRDHMGEILAQLDDVRTSMHIDWMTRGLARFVMLSWPGGRRVVFRSFRRRRAQQVLETLVGAGIAMG
jgi:hypothetical protein